MRSVPVWWIVVGVVALALVILVAAVVPLLRRLGRLLKVQKVLQRRVMEAQRRLAPALAALQQRSVELQTTLQTTQERAAILQARRGQSSD